MSGEVHASFEWPDPPTADRGRPHALLGPAVGTLAWSTVIGDIAEITSTEEQLMACA